MRVKSFTDNDLDGFGCNYLLLKKLQQGVIDTTFTDPIEVNTVVKSFLESKEYLNFDKIYITDLSVNEENAALINSLVSNENLNLCLIDHHSSQSALDLQKYSWATIESTDTQGRKISATKLVFNMFSAFFNNDRFLYSLANDISDYDTYTWKEEDRIYPKHLNDIFKFYKRDLFLEHVDAAYVSGDYSKIIGDSELKIITILDQNFKSFLEERSTKLIKTDIHGYRVGVVLADYDISELGNHLSLQNPDLDFIVMIGLRYGSVYYRTVKNDIHLGRDFASIYNGGGHAKAAGSPIPNLNNILDLIIKEIFQK